MLEIKPGSQVYDRDGEYVGRVEAADPTLFRVRAAAPLSPVYYVPCDAVLGELPGDHEIFLRCAVDDLDRMGWLHPPHGYATPKDPFASAH